MRDNPIPSLRNDRHGIYKWQNAHRTVPPSHRRAASFSGVHPKREDSMTRDLDPSLQHLHEVGGFRRQFVRNQAVERGEEVPRMLRSFVDFLFLYGHFVSLQAYGKCEVSESGLLIEKWSFWFFVTGR